MPGSINFLRIVRTWVVCELQPADTNSRLYRTGFVSSLRLRAVCRHEFPAVMRRIRVIPVFMMQVYRCWWKLAGSVKLKRVSIQTDQMNKHSFILHTILYRCVILFPLTTGAGLCLAKTTGILSKFWRNTNEILTNHWLSHQMLNP